MPRITIGVAVVPVRGRQRSPTASWSGSAPSTSPTSHTTPITGTWSACPTRSEPGSTSTTRTRWRPSLLVEHLRSLKRGGAVEIPIYDFTTHARTAETLHVEPAPIILVEGILIFVEPGAAGAARRQAVCRHRRRPALHPPAGTRHQRTWADAGVGHRAVPEDRAPDAPRIRGAQQALRRRHHPRGRVQRGGDRDGSRPHPRVVREGPPPQGVAPPTVAPPLGLRWSTLTIPQPKQRRLRSVAV